MYEIIFEKIITFFNKFSIFQVAERTDLNKLCKYTKTHVNIMLFFYYLTTIT